MDATTADAARPSAPPAVEVHWSAGEVTVRDVGLFGPGGEESAHQFLRHVLALAEVRAVIVDRAGGTAVVLHDDPDSERFPARLAAALRGAVEPLAAADVPRPPVEQGVRASWSVRRHGKVLTSFEVAADTPGRLRLRGAALGDARVEAALGAAPGVVHVRFSRWTDSLVVVYDPEATDAAALIRRAEAAARSPAALPAPVPVRFGMANTTLGVAAAGELLLPVLSPVSAVLLVGTNLKTFRDAAGQLRRGQLGLPVLYTAIAAATLATGQYVTCALMTWMFRYWTRRTQNDLHRERLRLAEELRPELPEACLVTARGSAVRRSTAGLRPGNQVVVAAGEVIPADGRVSSGGGLVDERGLAWGGGVLSRLPGDPVQAGSTVLTGQVRVVVERAGEATRAAALGRAIEAATRPVSGPFPLTPRAERFAGRTVGPTLAMAGVGLLVGDLGTALAILRPDYATGPGLAGALGALRDVELGLSRGVLVRDPSVLLRLPSVGLIAIDDHPSLRRPGLDLALVQTPLPESDAVLRYAASAARHLGDARAEALASACRERSIPVLRLDAEVVGEAVVVRHHRRHVRLYGLPPGGDPAPPFGLEIDGTFVGSLRFRRARRPAAAGALARLATRTRAPVVLLSDQPTRAAAALAAQLGIAWHLGGLSIDDKVRFLGDCRARGLRPAWVGASSQAGRLTPVCHVAIAHADEADPDRSPAAALLLSFGLDPLADLWELAAGHAERLRRAEQFVVVPNLLCVAGALTLGFSSLTAVCLTNLGTYGVYTRSTDSLRALRSGRTRGRRPALAFRDLHVGGVPRVATSA
jgi:cation transport ATPase